MAGETISGSHSGGSTLNFGPTQNPATVASGATVSASGVALVADPGTVWTITNYGVIKGSGATGIGVVLDYSETSPALNGGLIFNRSTGTIYGSDRGINLEHGGTVFNQGRISAGPNGFDPGAIYTDSGGSVTNQSGGVISAANNGIIGVGAGTVTVVNQGTVTTGNNGIYVYQLGGSVTNQSGGTIHAGGNGIELVVATAVYTGSVANLAGGTIKAGNYGIYVSGGTVVNQGFVSASSVGLRLTGGSTGTNKTGGTIIASGNGAELYGGGTFTNQSGGTISAGSNGIVLNQGSALTAVNQGVVSAGHDGILLGEGGYATNAAGALISGSVAGVVATGDAATLLNAGTIAASGTAGDAVTLAPGYADRLVIDPGAVFIGTVSGGNTVGASQVSTLELASGAAAGTLSGLGSNYIDFARIIVDPNASWVLAGGNALAAGITLAQGGTLVIAESLANSGLVAGSVTLGAGAVLTNASGGTITSSGVAAVYGSNSGPNTLMNGGSIEDAAGYGVSLGAGGTVINASGGTITGYRSGVYITGATGTVANDGSIAGGQVAAVVLDEGGQVTNQSGGTITGYGFGRGVGIYDAAGSVINFGSIASSSGYAVYLENGGAVTNQSGGTITGYAGADGVAIHNAPGTVANLGLIASTGGSAIYVFNSGFVTNLSGGTVAGQNAGVILGIGGTVINDGSISAASAAYAGIVLKSGGQVTNQSGGTISGNTGADGVSILNAAGTVINAGTISGTTDAVRFAAGFANRLVVDPGAVFTGTVTGGNTLGAAAVSTLELASGASAGTLSGIGTSLVDFAQITIGGGATWTLSSGDLPAGYAVTDLGGLINAATLASPITLGAGAYFSNISGGTLIGGGTTAILGGSGATVVNAGLIDPAAYGVYLPGGGTVTNISGGTIVGTAAGVKVSGAAGTVVNAGSLYATGPDSSGIELISGGSVTNQSGGIIDGTLYGVGSSNAAMVTNSGRIGVDALVGIGLAFGQVTNTATGTIAGSSSGIRIYGGGTVVDAGIISGGGDAVHFYPGSAARLVIDPGAAFYGTVDGGNTIGATAASTLELAVGGSAGTLTGLGTQFVDFVQVTVDAGAYWTLQATDTVGSGVTLTNAGTLSGTVTLAPGGELSNTTTGMVTVQSGAAVYGLTGGGATVVNTGLIANTGTSAGSLDSGIDLVGGGGVTNQSSGTISGYVGIYSTNAPLTVVNYASIAGAPTSALGVGVDAEGGGGVTNQSGGTISGYVGIYSTNAPLTVVNAGVIAGNTTSFRAAGVYISAGGGVTNLSSGTISGYNGIYANAGLTVVNDGSIVARYGAGIVLYAGGSVTNNSGGTIGGYGGIYAGQGALTVVNAGNIAAFTDGIRMFGGGSVTNETTGTISGYDGIFSVLVAATVVNAGDILGSTAVPSGEGVILLSGGYISNQSGGTISGYRAIDASGYLTVVNDGGITGYAGGIGLSAGGYVTNQGGGTISGRVAVYGNGAAATVVNAGSILGATAGTFMGGIVLLAGGSVINQSGGTISGYDGVYGGTDGGLTLVNAGSITGYGAAVQFVAGYADRVVFDPNAAFTGLVDGGNTIGGTAVSTLELAAGGSAGTLSGFGTQFVNFVQTTIDAGARWTLTGADTFAAGTTLVNAGTLTVLDTTLSDAGLVINNGTILIDPSTVTLTDLTGTGTTVIDGGSTLDVLGSVTVGETIVFSTGSGLLGVNPTAFAGQIDGFIAGDTIELTGVTDGYSPQIINTNTLEVLRSGGNPTVYLTLDPSVDYTGDVYAISNTGAVTDTTPCFLRGTLIRTESGEAMVQDLAVGDRVLTLSGQSRPVTWIGIGRVMVSPGRRCAATPVIVRKGALADNVPHRDLYITKGHALFVKDVLIPVEFLINHRSILWDDHQQTVAFYHIELDAHDVLLANGAPSESYRDDGNRWLFQNANTGWDLPPRPPCAPVLTGGPIVDAVWRQLLNRAGSRPGVPLIDDPDLHLLVDGVRVDAASREGTAYTFRLTIRPQTVRIVSRAAAPAELGLARDPRRLGVALRWIMVSRGARLRMMEAADPALGDGFHGFEPALGLRWTEGDAVVPAALFEGFDGPMELVLHLGGATRYPAFMPAVARAAA